MIPRFANPHFLPETTIRVSRKGISDDAEDEVLGKRSRFVQDHELVEELNQLLHVSLGVDVQPSRKRSKKELVLKTSEVEEPVLFRLISLSLPPRSILLEPKPPPSAMFAQEPDYEDNANQASRREEQAKAAAVDLSWILNESQKSNIRSPRAHEKSAVPRTTLPTPAPVVMILESDQAYRTTRPPVPGSQLAYHPYTKNGLFLSTDRITKRMDCPLISVDFRTSYTSSTKGKRKRKRGKMSGKERPASMFWSPNPAHGGKGLGYAMGYPCSIEALKGNCSSKPQYSRDTMRKGIHVVLGSQVS